MRRLLAGFIAAVIGSTLLLADGINVPFSFPASTCTNQFIRSIAASTGVGTCASVAIGSDVSGLGTNVGAWLATASSANLAAALTDETGTGISVFGTAPTFTTSIFVNSGDATGVRVGDGTNDYTFARNAASGNLFISGSQAAASGFRFRVNNTTEVFTLTNAGVPAFPLITNAATTSALCFNTGTGVLTYNSTVGTCTVSILAAKNLIAPLSPEEGCNIVSSMNPWRYGMKQDLPTYIAGEQIGMIADFAAKVDPRLVAYNPDGSVSGFRYEQYTAALTACQQHLTQTVLQQQKQIDKLITALNQQENRQ